MKKHIVSKLTAGAVIITALAACSKQPHNDLRYISASSKQDYTVLSSNCIEQPNLSEGTQQINFNYKETNECFGKLDTWIGEHLNQKVFLMFGSTKIGGPMVISSKIGPNNLRVTSSNHDLLSQIKSYMDSNDHH